MPILSLNKLAFGQVHLEPSPYPSIGQPSQIPNTYDLTAFTLYLNQDRQASTPSPRDLMPTLVAWYLFSR
jgi:hypothetical protein